VSRQGPNHKQELSMHLARSVAQKLDQWRTRQGRRPLLVRGARQVGKSFAIREWGKSTFGSNFVEINFEERPQFKRVFENDLDVTRLLEELSLLSGSSISQPGTLLFLDEIQACPQALTALRYFYEKKPELFVIAAGSLIEFAIDELSFPVGRIESLDMHPLTFFEFLDAVNKTSLKEYLTTVTLGNAVSEPAHEELLLMLKRYIYVGGMPQAVATYAATNDLVEVARIHSELARSFEDDFAKYARQADWQALQVVFTRSPGLVGRTKVKYSAYDRELRSEKIKRALLMLERAGLINKVTATSATKPPLSLQSKTNTFKIISLDIGLLQHQLGFDWRHLDPNESLSTLANGALAEQFVGQELLAASAVARQHALHYWQRDAKGSDAEIDYLLLQHNQIVPIEVKSGKRGTLKSLDRFLSESNSNNAYVLSHNPGARDGNVTWVPLYLASRLIESV
jgi:uncharacterized protein